MTYSERWLLPAAAFVAFQLVAVAGIAAALGFHQIPPFAKYFTTAGGVFGAVAVGIALWRLRSFPDSPVDHLKQYDWKPIRQLGLAMILVWLQFVCLTWAKVMIPMVGPMWADVPLADIERAVLGADAWHYLPANSLAVIWAYAMWPFAVTIAFVVAFFMQSERRDAALLSYFLVIGLLGTFGQFLLPSGGPIYFERLGFGDRFATMEIPAVTQATSDYLWRAYESHSTAYGAGISAFPSIHVATTAWIAVATRHWLAWSYLTVIFVGSVTLGWHYALDGVAGIVGAFACYALAKALLAWKKTETVYA